MRDFAYHYRPKKFEDILSQDHLLAKNAPFRVLCEKKTLGHSFFYGSAGCGKTTLARVVAKELDRPFYELNATTFKLDELRAILAKYTNTLEKPLIFIDEVHRLSKNQQEVLLPFMEKNQALFLGASTENPFYSLTSAIRSRSMVFELKKVGLDELKHLAKKVADEHSIKLDNDALDYLCISSSGDARAMLKLLEFSSSIDSHINLKTLKSLRPQVMSDGSSEDCIHYNLASALIKSIRGSDINASLYYLARLIAASESATFIARRLVILASEDIGNANPQALVLANSAMQSVATIGFPEARIILSQVVIYLASSPKSNASYKAIDKALDYVKTKEELNIPKTIKQNPDGYKNPHDFGGWVEQKYLEKDLDFLTLSENGYEKKIKEWMAAMDNLPQK